MPFCPAAVGSSRYNPLVMAEVSKRILIVDDEEPIRRFAERALRDAGYETIVAPDGETAVKLFEERGPFDLLLSDLMMPGIPGDELARRLRQLDPELKVLYLTAYSDRLFQGRTTLWEQEAFVDKPVSLKGLLEAVALMFSGHV
jgi:two-component system, cell cycle sensor histidine kinase and response regulator CckA